MRKVYRICKIEFLSVAQVTWAQFEISVLFGIVGKPYMDSEDRQKLNRALELAEENNKLIKKLVRAMRWGRFIRAIYWVIIIAVSVGSLYFIQPYLEQIKSIYGTVGDAANKVNNILKP
jgi:hypothetical protein